jgi:monomeric sarcosine oxidase
VRQQRIVIVGGGIVGLSTAYDLLAQGTRQVIVLEQESVDHLHSTSHGVSRLLRFEYGNDNFYSSLVRLSLRRWQRFQEESHRTLYTETGVLAIGRQDDGSVFPSFRRLRQMGLPIVHLTPQECRSRFPQFAFGIGDFITYSPGGGILYASACLQALKRAILDMGGQIYEHCRVTQVDHENQARPVRLLTGNGDVFEADRVALATGPWVHRLLADLRLPVRLTRQYLLYFDGLSPSAYSIGRFPAFISDDLYGFPMHYSRQSAGYGPTWLKLASHAFGAPVDPDERQPPDQRVIRDVVDRLQARLPALRQARLVKVDACMYDVTPDESFILDYVPDDPRIVFATGLTGHGFKFGLLLGEIVSSMIYQEWSPVPLDRFRLARFAPQLTNPMQTAML